MTNSRLIITPETIASYKKEKRKIKKKKECEFPKRFTRMAAIEIHIVCSLCCFDQTGHSDGTKERNEKSNSAFKRWRQRGRDYFSSVKKRGGTPTRTHGDGKAREESRKWRRRKKKKEANRWRGKLFKTDPYSVRSTMIQFIRRINALYRDYLWQFFIPAYRSETPLEPTEWMNRCRSLATNIKYRINEARR